MTNRLRRADPVGRLLTDPEVATPAFVIDDAKLQVNLDFAKEKAVSVRKYSGAVLELDYEFFNVTRDEVCTVASSKHCFTRDGKLISLKREIPELDVLFRNCVKGE